MRNFTLMQLSIVGALLVVIAAVTWIAVSDRIDAWDITRTCSRVPDSQQCITDALGARLSRDGDMTHIYSLAHFVYGAEDFATNCSPLMSRLGAKAYYEHYDVRWDADTVHCNYAFMQTYVREMTLTDRTPGASRDFCELLTKNIQDVPGIRAECYRGVGQSLPFISEDHATKPDVMIEYAIRQCESLVDEPTSRKLCVSGAFQYLDIAEANNLHGLSIESPEALGICAREREPYREICNVNMKRVLLRDVEMGSAGFSDVISRIRSANPHVSIETLEVLVHTLGFDRASLLQPDPDFDDLIQECSATESALHLSCVRGVALGLVKNAPADRQIGEIKRFCELVNVQLGPDVAQHCLSEASVDFLLGTLDPEHVWPLCVAFGNELCEGKLPR